MSYTYKMVQIPRNIMIESGWSGKLKADPTNAAALYVEEVVNKMAAQGWEFYRIDTIGVSVSPGCLAALRGQEASSENCCVIAFRRDGP